jgi:hypothetical protein
MAALHQEEQDVTDGVSVIEQRLEESEQTGRQAEVDVEVTQKVMGYEIDKKQADDARKLQDLF